MVVAMRLFAETANFCCGVGGTKARDSCWPICASSPGQATLAIAILLAVENEGHRVRGDRRRSEVDLQLAACGTSVGIGR